MSSLEIQNFVNKLLSSLRGLKPLKKLFSELNYDLVNQPLSRRNWPDLVSEALAEDPILLATGSEEFHIIYTQLKSSQLLVKLERAVVEQLLKEHPYSLFVFSNNSQDYWHFINVKYDIKQDKRQVFRRITVSEKEQLRTAVERLSLLDLDSLGSESPLAIQECHDRAFDVEKVTQKFFEQYRVVFDKVEKLIAPTLKNPEQRRLFTQKLFNRLMFIAFIQKKGWLNFQGRTTDYLEALWQDYQKQNHPDRNFYRDRLSHLFFLGLNNPAERDILSVNRKTFEDLIGIVPYLNGGLFEQDSEDREGDIVIPDEAIASIFHDLFSGFNFTVTESTPFDIEVAVDPEMLGKVFEELVTGRHESGSYYTQKPIVSFMCREALKGYLRHQIPQEKIEAIAAFVDEQDSLKLTDSESVMTALKTIKICDPACGSGAYLLGILHELLDLRQCLFASKGLDAKTIYQRKLQIIENNIYGVDLDTFAVNIARLRLWLSLAVEYEGNDPPPLPNLKFKIEDGDSLIAPNPQGAGMFRDELISQYRESKAKYLRAHLGEEKQKLIKEIAGLKADISLFTHGSTKVSGFDWGVEFAEVFAEGGFDAIVANPPYVRQELIKELKPTLKKVYPEVYTGTSDLYCFFYGRSLQLLKPRGMLAFISPNKWFRAKYGEKLRQHIAETCQVYSITDFGDLPVFQSATTYPMIFIAQNGNEGERSAMFTQVKSLDFPYPDVLAIIKNMGANLPNNAIKGANWVLTNASAANRLQKMESAGIPLGEYVKGKIYRGVLTGFNKAFYIDGKIRAKLICQDAKSAHLIKPLAVGDDVRKWNIKETNKWLIVTPIGIDVKKYPAIFSHLQQWQPELEKRYDRGKYWWELRACNYYSTFEYQKIIFPDIAKESRFALDKTGTYINDTTFMITSDELYLLGVLNSSSVYQYFLAMGAQIRGDYLRFKRQYIEKIPIPYASETEKSAISELVQKCLDAKGVNCEQWEKEIDERVAALYGL